MSNRRSWTETQLNFAVAQSRSYAQVLTKLGLKPTGGNYKQLQKYIEKLQLNISHFSSKGWRKGAHTSVKRPIDLSDILIEKSYFPTCHLRIRLIREGLLEEKCSNCLRKTWQGLKIPLELDHINGINTDHRIQNLRLLCPNCHAQTPTFGSKNKIRAGMQTGKAAKLKP